MSMNICRTQRSSHIFRLHPAAAATPCSHRQSSLFMQSNHPDCIEKPADAHLDLVILASAFLCTAALATHCMITLLRRLVVPAPRALLRYPINFYLIYYSPRGTFIDTPVYWSYKKTITNTKFRLRSAKKQQCESMARSCRHMQNSALDLISASVFEHDNVLTPPEPPNQPPLNAKNPDVEPNLPKYMSAIYKTTSSVFRALPQ
jgi:hypothetical protein